MDRRLSANKFWITFLILIPWLFSHSQVLIKTGIKDFAGIQESSIIGSERYGSWIFAIVSDIPSGLTKSTFEILDADPETGIYYWIENRNPQQNPVNISLPFDEDLILWKNQQGALIRSESYLFLKRLSMEWTGFRIPFDNLKPAGNGQRPSPFPKEQTSLSDLQAIVDSVNLDSLTLTVGNLSGEAPYWINGLKDSIMTRYSSTTNPDIEKAREYIIHKLESYGYSVESQYFTKQAGACAADPEKPKTGWAVLENKIYKTEDGGQNWHLAYQDPEGRAIRAVDVIDSETIMAAGGKDHILKSEDSGKNWREIPGPVREHLFGIEFINESFGWICGDRGKVLKTTDGGNSWMQMEHGGDIRFYDVTFINEDEGWLFGKEDIVWGTSDGGRSWTKILPHLIEEIPGISWQAETLNPYRKRHVYADKDRYDPHWTTVTMASYRNIIVSKTGVLYPDYVYIIGGHYDSTSNLPFYRAPGADDNGSGTAAVIEAARIMAPFDFNYTIKFILFDREESGLYGSQAYAYNAFNRGENIMGVINLDMIGYDSNDDGFFEIHSGVYSASQEIGMAIGYNISDFNLPLTGYLYTTGSSSSSDHSSFWNYGYPAVMVIERMHGDFNAYYHSTNDLLVHMNPDYFHNLSRLAIGSLAELAEVAGSSVSPDPALPETFILYDPYPNPFNPLVNIEYTLAERMHVQADIYDLLGRKVKTLFQGEQIPGSHSLTWDGKDDVNRASAAGVYFIKLDTPDETQIRKVILMK